MLILTCLWLSSGLGEQRQELFQSDSHPPQTFLVAWAGEGQRRLIAGGLALGQQMLAGAGNGESFVIKQALDFKSSFDIISAVHALPGAAFRGLELRKLSLPEAQDISRQAAEPGHLSDAKVQLVGDQHFLRTGSGGCVLSLYSWTGRGGSSGTQLKSLYSSLGLEEAAYGGC